MIIETVGKLFEVHFCPPFTGRTRQETRKKQALALTDQRPTLLFLPLFLFWKKIGLLSHAQYKFSNAGECQKEITKLVMS